MSPKEEKVRRRKGDETKAKPTAVNVGKKVKDLVERRKRIQFDDDLIRKATGSKTHRLWLRTVVIFSVMIIVYFFTKDQREVKFALQKENIILRSQKLQCSPKYLSEMKDFPKCVPEMCGRFVSDSLVDPKEVEILQQIAQKGFELGSSDGGASILDLHTGALSQGEKFVNIFKLPKAKDLFKKEHLITYKLVKSKIKAAIAERFQVDANSLYLTHPTFFSKLTNITAKNIHDEYWHPHVDKDTYKSFHYTSLLYLSDYGHNFQGGRFLFTDGDEKNRTVSAVEPKRGRLSAFTSGAENLHNVEKVTSGERYAITISFTCDARYGIEDPKLEA